MCVGVYVGVSLQVGHKEIEMCPGVKLPAFAKALVVFVQSPTSITEKTSLRQQLAAPGRAGGEMDLCSIMG